MVSLAAELLEAELVEYSASENPSMLKKIACLTRRRGDEDCLVVCSTPKDLEVLALLEGNKPRLRKVVGWIIDSFWTEWVPWVARYSSPYTELFVTRQEDVVPIQQSTKRPVRWLGWGSDVLRLGSANTRREYDLLRVGRQPPEWEDDVETARMAQKLCLTYRGRPPFFPTPEENQRELMREYAKSKFLLAFSNSADESTYTHSTREYITFCSGNCSEHRGYRSSAVAWCPNPP
jgi:hypothetical protein